MTVTVIGHLCIDEVAGPGGSRTDQFGGIYYSVAALSLLLPRTDTVRPVFGIHSGDHAALLEALSAFPNVDDSGIYRTSAPTNRVTLREQPGGERTEVSRDIAEPVPWPRIRRALDTDLVLVNMISGFDVTIETLDEIRMKTRERTIPVVLDLHSLTLGVRDDFERFRRPVEAWRRWLFMLHTVQMNEAEAAAVSPEGYGEEDLAKQTLALGTKALCITRGPRGATVFAADRKRIARRDVPGRPAEGTVNTTGCGDVFGAAYCASLLHGAGIDEAAARANEVASARAALGGSPELGGLARFRPEEASA